MASRPPQSLKARTDATDRARSYLKTMMKLPVGSSVVEYAPPLDRSRVLEIASDILQVSLSPDQNGRYYLTCPGAADHQGGKNARRDCEFMPDGAPTLRCFHKSCEAARDELNRSIRSACGKAKVRQFTDSTARATKAAEALVIGFDMADAEVKALLAEWALLCDPQIPSADLSAALKSAKRSYARAVTEHVGCLLHGRSMPARLGSPHPPRKEGLSVVSGAISVSKSSPNVGVGVQEPIYIGARGQLAKEAKRLIEDYEDNYGIRPYEVLVGTSFEGDVPDRICGLPAVRWNHVSHSVVGKEYGNDG